MAAVFTQIGHAMAAVVVGYVVLVAYRWIRRQSEAVGAIVALTILARAAMGLALFWISYTGLPVAESLQRGGGFWTPMRDAKGYYDLAAAAASAGTWASDPVQEVPARVFVNTLTIWMGTIGISPAAGMFLNLCLYLGLVVALVRCFKPVNDWRRDLPCIVAVAAYSLSPVVLLHSTQTLKEEFTSVLVALGCLATLMVVRLIRRRSSLREHGTMAAGAAALTVTIAALAGIRWYYALLLWSALAAVLMACALRGRTVSLPVYAVRSIAVLLLAWVGFWVGAGPYYGFVAPHVQTLSRIRDLPVALASIVQMSRAGFLTTVGDTNIAVPLRDDPSIGRAHAAALVVAPRTVVGSKIPPRAAAVQAAAAPTRARHDAAVALTPALQRQIRADRAIPVTFADHLKVITIGLAITFLPLAVVGTFLPIDMAAGDGMFWVTDLDIVVLDAGALALLVMLWRRRRLVGDRLPLVVIGLVYSAMVAVLLGYVVTNFGALSRMRPLIGVPLWMLAAALAPCPKPSEQPRPADVAGPATV